MKKDLNYYANMMFGKDKKDLSEAEDTVVFDRLWDDFWKDNELLPRTQDRHFWVIYNLERYGMCEKLPLRHEREAECYSNWKKNRGLV